MKRFEAILVALLTAVNAGAWSVPTGANNWTNDVEANANSIQNNSREFAHGETWYISPRVVDSGVPRNIDTNTTWVMYYQTPQMTTNWYTNASVYFPVYDSTGATVQVGRVSALWDASKDFGHRRYLYWLGGTVGGQITYRIMGEISLRDSPGFNAAAVTAPVGSWPYVSTSTLGASGAVWRAEWQAADAVVTASVPAIVGSILLTGVVGTATYAATAGSASNAVTLTQATNAALAVVAPYTNGAALGATATQPNTATNIAEVVASAYLPLAGGAFENAAEITWAAGNSDLSSDTVKTPSVVVRKDATDVWTVSTPASDLQFVNGLTASTWLLLSTPGAYTILSTTGSGAGLTGITAAQVGAVSTNGGTVNGTLGGSNAVASSDFMTYEQGLSLLGGRSVWYMRGAKDTAVTWAYMTSTDIPTTNWTVTIPTATAGTYGPSWVITNLSGTVIKEGVINVSGIGSSYNAGGGRTASYKWEAYVTNTVTGGVMPEWSDQGSVKVLTGTADYLPMTIAIAIPTNLPTGSALIIRSKVTAAVNTPTITIIGGSNSLSSISLPTGLEANLGTRGATGIQAFGGVATGSYDTVTRVLTMPALTFTNGTTQGDGVLNGTNGVYFVFGASTNRYWILGGN